jgi:hypothetical protein
MNTKEVETPHTEGPRWEIIRRFKSYNDANTYRNGLLVETDNLQAKVHLMGATHKKFFAVKTRSDPSLAQEEESRIRREAKKKRKSKLNKKRRKK